MPLPFLDIYRFLKRLERLGMSSRTAILKQIELVYLHMLTI